MMPIILFKYIFILIIDYVLKNEFIEHNIFLNDKIFRAVNKKQ